MSLRVLGTYDAATLVNDLEGLNVVGLSTNVDLAGVLTVDLSRMPDPDQVQVVLLALSTYVLEPTVAL